MNEQDLSNVNPMLQAFQSKGGLFDIPADCSLFEDVGEQVRYINPKWPAEEGIFIIEALQKNYAGELCYRVVNVDHEVDPHRFGRPVKPHLVEFVK